MSGISGAHLDFPLVLWDPFVKQANTRINLLGVSRINPKLLACAQLFGTFNYDATLLAPPWYKYVVNNKPNVRGTWSVHGLNVYYVGPAMQQCRFYEVYITKTSSKQVSDPVTLLSHDITIHPVVSRKSALAKIEDLIKLLSTKAKSLPFQMRTMAQV